MIVSASTGLGLEVQVTPESAEVCIAPNSGAAASFVPSADEEMDHQSKRVFRGVQLTPESVEV